MERGIPAAIAEGESNPVRSATNFRYCAQSAQLRKLSASPQPWRRRAFVFHNNPPKNFKISRSFKSNARKIRIKSIISKRRSHVSARPTKQCATPNFFAKSRWVKPYCARKDFSEFIIARYFGSKIVFRVMTPKNT